MKNSVYYSAILGMAFLSIRFVGLFIDLTYNDLFLIVGLGILLFVTLPLYLVDRKKYLEKKRSILKRFQKEPHINQDKAVSKGTDYPSFRKQKSGLTWGGGNIHGSGAKRGTKRGFLKH